MKTDVIVDPSFKPILVETANTLSILLTAPCTQPKSLNILELFLNRAKQLKYPRMKANNSKA